MHNATKQQKRETSELEALVSGVNSVSQATLQLKKMRESREVDDALDYMKEQYVRRTFENTLDTHTLVNKAFTSVQN